MLMLRRPLRDGRDFEPLSTRANHVVCICNSLAAGRLCPWTLENSVVTCRRTWWPPRLGRCICDGLLTTLERCDARLSLKASPLERETRT